MSKEETKLQYVTLDQAKKLKQVGFTWRVNRSYTEYLTTRIHEEDGDSGPCGWRKGEVTTDSDWFENTNPSCDYSNEEYIQLACPTVALALKWLRAERRIHIEVHATMSQINFAEGYNWWIWYPETGMEEFSCDYSAPKNTPAGEFSHDSYEGCESGALDWMLNYLIQKP